MFHNCEGQSRKTVSTDYNFLRKRRAEADSNRGPSADQSNALLLGQTGHWKMNNQRPQTSKNVRYFLNYSNGTTNNDNPGTANVKTCALLLNNGASGPVVVNHGGKRKRLGEKKRRLHTSHKDIQMYMWPPARGLIPHRGITKRTEHFISSLRSNWN